MMGVAVERWNSKHKAEVYAWLYKVFGNQSKQAWFEDHDYDLFTLCMNDEIYSMYILKWE